MNELEIIYFSIYLDKFGWECAGLEFEDNLLLTAFAAKMYLNDNMKYIIEFLNRTKNKIMILFNDWLKSKKDYSQMSIHPKELNIRYNQLIKPSNPFCKTNFIDFNFVVDQILQMSLPYSDTKNNNNINNSFTELSGITFKNNDAAYFNNNIPNKNTISHSPPSLFHNKPSAMNPGMKNQVFFKNDEQKSINASNDNSNFEHNHSILNKLPPKEEDNSGIFRLNSDNNFLRENSAFNIINNNEYFINRESSNNNLFPQEQDEEKYQSFRKNQSQNTAQIKEEINQKNNENEGNQPQYKLSLPISSDNTNLYNKYKNKNQSSDNLFIENSNNDLNKEKNNVSFTTQYFQS